MTSKTRAISKLCWSASASIPMMKIETPGAPWPQDVLEDEGASNVPKGAGKLRLPPSAGATALLRKVSQRRR